MKWDKKMSFDANIHTISNIIRKDYRLNDSEANELLLALEKVTPEMVDKYFSIYLRAKTTTLHISIDMGPDSGLEIPQSIELTPYSHYPFTSCNKNYILVSSFILLTIFLYFKNF